MHKLQQKDQSYLAERLYNSGLLLSSESGTNPLLPSKNVLDLIIRKHDRLL